MVSSELPTDWKFFDLRHKRRNFRKHYSRNAATTQREAKGLRSETNHKDLRGNPKSRYRFLSRIDSVFTDFVFRCVVASSRETRSSGLDSGLRLEQAENKTEPRNLGFTRRRNDATGSIKLIV